MARLTLATAGAIVGGMTGIPGGAQLGWALGSMLGGTFEPNQKSAGPRLGDLAVSGSAYGTPIPYVAGSPRVSGQIVWASAKREIATTTTQGKGGGGGQEYTTYTYEIDLLLLLSDNQIGGITRVWSNGALVWSALAGTETVPSSAGGGATLTQSPGTIEGLMASGGTGKWARMTVYGGAPSQLPDPTYEAAVGTANAPAYRGRGSVFIQSLQLGSSGQLPNLTFELAATSGTATVLALQHFEQPGELASQGAHAGVYYKYRIYSGLTAGVGPAWGCELVGNANGGGEDDYNTESGVREPGMVGASSFLLVQTGTFNSAGALKTSYQYGCAFAPLNSSMVVGSAEDFTLEFVHDPIDGIGAYNKQIYVSSTSAICMVYGNQGANGSWYLHNYYTGTGRGYLFSIQGPGGGGVNGGNVPSTTRPVRVCVTRTSGTVRMYYDGVLAATGAVGANTAAITDPTGYEWLVGFNTRGPGLVAAGGAPGRYDEILFIRGHSIASGATYTVAAGQYADASSFAVATRTPPTVKAVVDALLLVSGLGAGQVDTTALATITTPVRALAVGQVSSVRAVLHVLAQAYNFEAVLSDKLYLRVRGSSSVASVPFVDLGCDGADPFALRMVNELEVPAQLAVTYANMDNDHQSDTQYSDRLLTGQESTSATQLPLSLYPTEAKAMASGQLMDKAISMTTTKVAVGMQYAKYEPCDVVTVADNDANTWRMRIAAKTEAAGTIQWDLVLDDANVFIQPGATSAGTQGQTVVYAPPQSSLLLLDLPLLQDADNAPGHYFAIKGITSGWQSAALYQSSADNNYQQNQAVFNQATFGVSTTALAAYTGAAVFDEQSTVTVNVDMGQLSSATREAVLADVRINAAVLGAEVLQYRTATLVSAGVYTLSGFLRGRKGTEWAMGAHPAGETFCALGVAGMGLVAMQSADLGKLWYYKAASAGQKLSSAATKTFTPAGVLLKPLAPTNLRVNRASTSTVFTWLRRTRFTPRFTGTLGINVPLGESAETYDVEFYSDATFTTLKRTYAGLTTPTVTYTSANQVTDFGANQIDFFVKVYQNSAVVGRGYPLTSAEYKPYDPDVGWLTTSGSVTLSAFGRNAVISGTYSWVRSKFQSLGKRYFEFQTTPFQSGSFFIGLVSQASDPGYGGANAWGGQYIAWGNVYVAINGAFNSNPGVTVAPGDRVGLAVDLATGMVWFLKNGVANIGNPVAGTGGYAVFTPGTPVAPAFRVNYSGTETTTKFFTQPSNVTYPIAGFTGFL